MRWKTRVTLLLALTSTFGLAAVAQTAGTGESDQAAPDRGDYRARRNVDRDAYRDIRSQPQAANPYGYNDNFAADNHADDDQYPTNDRSAAHHQAALRAQAHRQARLNRLAFRTGRAPRLGFGTGHYGIVDSQGTRYRRVAPNVYQPVNPPPDRNDLMAERYDASRNSMEEAYLAGRNPFSSEGRFAYGTGGMRGVGRGINRVPPGPYSTRGTERTGGSRAVRGTAGVGGTGRTDIYGYQDTDRGAVAERNIAGGNEQRSNLPSTRPSSNQSRSPGSSR